MGASSSKSTGPKQELNFACGTCGKPALIFESFVSSGPVHELAAHQVSEMCAFLSNAPNSVRCQSCAIKAREALERENRYLAQETARNNELARQASVRSQRGQRSSGVYGVDGESKLRRTRSARSLLGRLRDSFFESEDYVTDHEDDDGPVTRDSSQRRSVRFASQTSIQPETPLNVTLPAQQVSYPGPPSAAQSLPPPAPQPVDQVPFVPTEQVTRDINAGPPVAAPPNLHIQTQGLSADTPLPTAPPISNAPLPRSFSPDPPTVAQLQQAPPNQSYTGASFTNPPPGSERDAPNQSYPGPSFPNPPPGAQRDMAYQAPPSANPVYAQNPMPPQGTINMPESLMDRLQRENSERHAALEQAERYRQEQESRYTETERISRENRKLAKRAEKLRREGKRREDMISGPPPRDVEPILGGGTRPPTKTKSRGEGYTLQGDGAHCRNSGQPGMLVQLMLLGKKVYDEWEKQY